MVTLDPNQKGVVGGKNHRSIIGKGEGRYYKTLSARNKNFTLVHHEAGQASRKAAGEPNGLYRRGKGPQKSHPGRNSMRWDMMKRLKKKKKVPTKENEKKHGQTENRGKFEGSVRKGQKSVKEISATDQWGIVR